MGKCHNEKLTTLWGLCPKNFSHIQRMVLTVVKLMPIFKDNVLMLLVYRHTHLGEVYEQVKSLWLGITLHWTLENYYFVCK